MNKGLAVPKIKVRPEQVLAESRLNAGMITSIDSVDIPNGALVVAKDVRCRLDKTSRRPGKINEAPAKPNSNKILGLVVFKKNDLTTHFMRFTKSTIYRRGVASWTNFTAGAGGALTGADTDYFSTAVIFNALCFANGVDKIQEVDTVASTYKEVGTNSPKVKYVTGFFNRVVGAYRVEPAQANGPVSLVWCADGDRTKWPDDASPDPSSGQSPLVESPSDLADFITGVFGGPSLLLIPREKSIWAATKNPSESNPFNAGAALPGIGSDCPRSIKVVPGGLAWLDTRTAQIYMWALGGPPEEIGTPVYSEIVRGISDPSQVIAGYDTTEGEYSVATPIAGTTVLRVWTHNRKNPSKPWVYDEVDALSLIADIDSPFSTVLSFDELVGTFDQLTGTFDSLAITSPPGKPARYYGYTNGEIYAEDKNSETDAGVSFTTDIQSKDFKGPDIDTYFSKISIKWQALRVGDLTLSYSKDHGRTWKVAKTITTQINKPGSLVYHRVVRATSLRWRITSSNGAWDLLEYSIHVQPSGESTEGA